MIPAMNQPFIGTTLKRVSKHVDHMIVVDELSAEFNTGKVAANNGAQAVYSRGRCLRSAVELGWAHTSTADDVVTIDGDGSNQPSQIPRLLDNPADVVVGSRFVRGGLYVGSKPRRLGSSLYGRAASYLTGLSIRDFGGGFRLYRNGIARSLVGTCHAKGHAYQAEVLATCHRQGNSIAEVPVTYLSSSTTLSWSDFGEAASVLARLASV